MDWTQIASFALVASLLAITPGPNSVLIAKTVPTFGRRAGFANVVGISAAFYVHGTLSIFGISLILVRSAEAFFVVKLVGAAYLIWIGLKALKDAWRGGITTPQKSAYGPKRPGVTAFAEGFVTNVLNPKVSMFYLAAFPQFISASDNAVASGFLLVFIHSAIVAIWYTAIILLFAKLTSATQSGLFQRGLKAITGVVFVGFGAKLLTLKP